MSILTGMICPSVYVRAIVPVAKDPPGASCGLTASSNGSPQMPHLPLFTSHCLYRQLFSKIKSLNHAFRKRRNVTVQCTVHAVRKS